MSEKQQGVAIIPTTENRPSGYTRFEPVPWQGRMKDGLIVEADDLTEERYLSGYDEIRRENAKRRLAAQRDTAQTR